MDLKKALLETLSAHFGVLPTVIDGKTTYGDGGYCADAVIWALYKIFEQASVEPAIPIEAGYGTGTHNFAEAARQQGALFGLDPAHILPGMILVGFYSDNGVRTKNGHTSVIVSAQKDTYNNNIWQLTTIDANYPSQMGLIKTYNTILVNQWLFNPNTGQLTSIGTGSGLERVIAGSPDSPSTYQLYAIGLIDPSLLNRASAVDEYLATNPFVPPKVAENDTVHSHIRETALRRYVNASRGTPSFSDLINTTINRQSIDIKNFNNAVDIATGLIEYANQNNIPIEFNGMESAQSIDNNKEELSSIELAVYLRSLPISRDTNQSLIP